MSVPFFFNLEYRAAFLANMAQRLQDCISADGAALLAQQSLKTPVTGVSFMLLLHQNGPSSIADIARAADYSHQRVASRISELERIGLVTRGVDEHDRRRKIIKLTALGESEIPALHEINTAAASAFEEMFRELDNDLMETLLAALHALKKKPLLERVANIKSIHDDKNKQQIIHK